jgi:hypothetical protein
MALDRNRRGGGYPQTIDRVESLADMFGSVTISRALRLAVRGPKSQASTEQPRPCGGSCVRPGKRTG